MITSLSDIYNNMPEVPALTPNKALDKLNQQNEQKYNDFFNALNDMLGRDLITSDEYRLFARTFEARLRSEATKKAIYKVGNRVTTTGSSHRRIIEITEVRVYYYTACEPWRFYIYYHGRKIDKYGNYTKTQPRGFGWRERDLVPFVPASPKS